MSDDKRVEPPVSNEELYVKLRGLYRLIALALAGVFAAAMGLASALNDPVLTSVTAVAAVSLLLLHTAWGSRNVLTRGFEWLVGDDLETLDELEGRLTDGARADGRGGDEQ